MHNFHGLLIFFLAKNVGKTELVESQKVSMTLYQEGVVNMLVLL